MKIRLKKLGQILVANDPVSKEQVMSLDGGIYTCTVAKARINNPPEEIRRAAQNRLYWGWLADLEDTKIEAVAGITKDDWHKRFKVDYLMKIFCRTKADYALLFAKLEIVLRELGADIYQNLFDGILELTSTTQASVVEFSEYLNNIERFAHERGVLLRTDSDVYDLACVTGQEQQDNNESEN